MAKRKLNKFYIIVFALLACNSKRKDIITLLGSQQNFRLVTSKEYFKRSGFCSSSLFLNSDSTFLNESGCEGRSYVTIGTWKYLNDAIELDALDNSKLSFISNIKFSTKNNISEKTFLIVDKAGKPVSNFIIIPMKNSEKYIFTSNPGVVLKADEKYAENYITNDLGMTNLDVSDYDSIIFPQLERLGNRKFRFSIKNIPDTITIQLNANKSGLQYSDVTYSHWSEVVKFKEFEHQLSNHDDTLIELDH